LDDLVQEEFYLEIRDSGSLTCQLGLAVRVDPNRVGMWETNLASIIESATGGHRTATDSGGIKGWSLQTANPTHARSPLVRHVEFVRAGDWTIVGLAPDQNPVFTALLTRAQQHQLSAASSTGEWLQTVSDLRRLSAALSWGFDLPQDWPQISLNITGNGTNVVTHGQFKFAQALPFEIERWNIPTNLIHEPLHSFTAAQGVKHWISSLGWWQNLHSSSAPNQIFCWAQSGSPFLAYAAAPLADAGKTMTKLGPGIMESMNPILAANRMGQWERAKNSDGVDWARSPIIAPVVHSVSVSQGNFLFAGLSPLAITNTPPPSGTMRELLSLANVVYFDREVTGPRLEAWMYISQLFRVIMRRAQLPSESDSVLWLKAIGPILGSSATTITKTSQTELSFSRTSSAGFTAPELHLIADWLESSQFPGRTHSVVAKYPPLPERHPGSATSPIKPNGQHP
jgi:hypothetical protein